MTGTTTATRTTYAEFLSRGLIVAETSSHPVAGVRDPATIARWHAGPDVYAFRFYDVVTTEANGIPLSSGHLSESCWYWIDAERLTAQDVAVLPGDHSVLLDNMRSNGWAEVARCRTGNFQPMAPGDVCISSETGERS